MRFEIAFACLAATSYGHSWSDTCLTWGNLCHTNMTQGSCCDGMICQYDSGAYNNRCLEPLIPEPHYHIECSAWGSFCTPGDGFCCDGLTCYTYPDPDVKGYYMCTPLATSLAQVEEAPNATCQI